MSDIPHRHGSHPPAGNRDYRRHVLQGLGIRESILEFFPPQHPSLSTAYLQELPYTSCTVWGPSARCLHSPFSLSAYISFLGLHNKVLQTGMAYTNRHAFSLRVEVPNQSVRRAMLPLNPPGKSFSASPQLLAVCHKSLMSLGLQLGSLPSWSHGILPVCLCLQMAIFL